MGLFARILSALGLRKRDDGDGDDDVGGGDADHVGARDLGGDAAAESASASASASASEPEPPVDDVVRDPELEAQDDCACFDFEHDIARYFTAEFRFEQAWHNPERRAQLFAEYEVRDGAHWYQVKATFERWLESPTGKAKYPNEDALVQARLTTTQTVGAEELEQMIEDARRAKGG